MATARTQFVRNCCTSDDCTDVKCTGFHSIDQLFNDQKLYHIQANQTCKFFERCTNEECRRRHYSSKVYFLAVFLSKVISTRDQSTDKGGRGGRGSSRGRGGRGSSRSRTDAHTSDHGTDEVTLTPSNPKQTTSDRWAEDEDDN
jgi:hypothetical protein